MKILLAIIALGASIATPASAQHAPHAFREILPHQDWPYRVGPFAPYPGDIFYENSQGSNDDADPDFHLER